MTEDGERELQGRWFLRRFVLRYGIGVIILIFYVTASLHFRYTPDDAYIFLQFGRNIARGNGFSFNAGMTNYGITAPLWALLIAAGTTLGLDPYIVAKTLDIVFASLTVICVLAFAFVLIRDRIYALVAAWIFSFDAWFLRWSGSGTETSLAMLLVMLCVWYAYRKEYVLSSLIAGLLTLVRLEGAILFAAVLADQAFNGRERTTVLRSIISSILLYSAVVGSWLTYCAVQFGTVVPNILKAGSAFGSSPAEHWNAAVSTMEIIGATQFLLVAFLIVGVLVTIRRLGGKIMKEEGFPLLWVLVLPAYYVLIDSQVVTRSLLLIAPIVVIYGVWGIKSLGAASIVSPQRGLLILLVVAGVSLAQNQYVYQRWVRPHMENFELGVSECLKPIAYWLSANAPAGASVLTPDAGIIGYVSGRDVWDTAGLVTPEVKRAFGGVGYDEGMVQKKYEQVVRPDYIVDRSLAPERLVSTTLKPIMTRTFSGLGIAKAGLQYYTLYEVIK